MNADAAPAVIIRPLLAADAPACDAIIAALPYHFGDAGGRAACATAVRTNDGLVALLNDRIVAFLTIERQFETSAEITWMAVHPDWRGQGIGHQLVAQLRDQLIAEGRRLLLVMTLGESQVEDVADSYELTRRFYRSCGFIPAREWEDFWPSNPAQLLVMPL